MTDLAPPTIMPRVGTMKIKNKRYFDGEIDYQRTSTMLENLKTWADTWNLQRWLERQVAIGMSMRPDLVLGVAAATQVDPATGKLLDDAKKAINGLCKQATDAAASRAGSNTGTAVHTATERLDLGETIEQINLPYPYSADLQAYETLKRVMGLELPRKMIERSVRNATTNTVGTIDRAGFCTFLREAGLLEPNEMIIVDVKTEQDPLLNMIHIAPQLANYAYAENMWVPEPTAENEYAGRYEPWPYPVSKRFALAIHIRAGRATPYLINIEQGWEAALGAAAQRDRSKRSKIKLGEPGCWAAAVPIELPPATEIVADAHARGPLGFSAPAGTTRAEYVAPQTVVVEQAERRPDGSVTWNVVSNEIPDGPQPLEAMLWEAIVSAPDLDSLSHLFERATATGVAWEGPIAEAGIKRATIVKCAQRSMHNPATTAKCACGWTRELAP